VEGVVKRKGPFVRRRRAMMDDLCSEDIIPETSRLGNVYGTIMICALVEYSIQVFVCDFKQCCIQRQHLLLSPRSRKSRQKSSPPKCASKCGNTLSHLNFSPIGYVDQTRPRERRANSSHKATNEQVEDMVSVRRSSSSGIKVESQVNGKRTLASQSPASLAKKRRKFDDSDDDAQKNPSFWDHSDSGDDIPSVNGIQTRSSKGKVETSTTQKKKKVNGTTSIPRPRGSGMLILADDDISLPDIFSAHKTLPKSPKTPTSRSKQSPAKSKSAKIKAGTPNGLSSPSKPAPRNSFNARLQAITEKTKEKAKEITKEPPLSENITVNGTTKSKPPPKGPEKQELDTIKQQVLGKLCGRIPIPLQGHPAQVATYLPLHLNSNLAREIHSLMKRAVHGESNSVLLLGGPGSAKSAIVTAALDQLKREHPEKGNFYTICLDGQIQTDDKIALREIARQLALEMNVETEKVCLFFNRADTRCLSRIL